MRKYVSVALRVWVVAMSELHFATPSVSAHKTPFGKCFPPALHRGERENGHPPAGDRGGEIGPPGNPYSNSDA